MCPVLVLVPEVSQCTIFMKNGDSPHNTRSVIQNDRNISRHSPTARKDRLTLTLATFGYGVTETIVYGGTYGT